MISIIVPVYNEESNLIELVSRLQSAVSETEVDFEIFFVNDGSSDRTRETIGKLQQEYRNIGALHLSRNFGKEVAIIAAIDHINGDAALIMDGDLQHPPEFVPTFLENRAKGFQIIQARRRLRPGETWVRKILSRFYYKVFSTLTNTKMQDGAGDFILLEKPALEAFRSLRERARFSKGLYYWIGFERLMLEYDVTPRKSGNSAWSLGPLLHLGIVGLISFSNKPLRLISGIGFAISISAILFGAWLIIRTLIFGVALPGYTSTLFFILLLGGANLFCIGIVGEYVGAIFEEAKERPLYIVSELNESQLHGEV